VRLGLSGKRIVLWAGTLGYAHGLDNVLMAAKLLQEESDIHFLFVGDGSARPSLIKMHSDLHLGNVTFRDPVPLDSVPAYFSIAFCGLASLVDIPAYEGARPSKLFPVLASGKPLIFVGKGEAAQLVERAQAGIVLPPGDPQRLADAFLRLARNPELAAELGRNGRRYVEQHLQWSSLVGEWLRQLTSSNGAQLPVAARVSKASL
jgi:glycosyltransferase involved in cell wall biosynthesis